jgi:hypothetical protein
MNYLRLFASDYIDRTPVEGIHIARDIVLLRKTLGYNISKIIKYYMERNFAVKNTFFLSRILEHIPVYLNSDAADYVNLIDRKVDYLTKHFKVTSEIEKGVVHPGYFFGKGNSELILSMYGYFNPFEVERNFRYANPIHILKHNLNDMRLLLPTGKETTSRKGICSIMINFNMLALKYREFMKENKRTGIELTKNNFIYKYVVDLMVADIQDHVLLNKLMDKYYGREEVLPATKHVFKLYEPDTQVNRYLDNTLDVITNKNHDYVNVLRNIQLISSKDASVLLKLPDYLPNKQLLWSMFISRLDHMLFLYDVTSGHDKNRHHINDWKRLVTRLEGDRVLDNKFDYVTESEIKERMYRIKQM